MPWARKVAVLSALIALIATVYTLGAATPQEALASSHEIKSVSPGWSLTPSGIDTGDYFRLIFFTSTKRIPNSSNIADYNTFVRDAAGAGHTNIRGYKSGFRVVGCTAADDARDNTATTFTNANKGVPIYWLKGNKVADNYQDFYNGNWDDEANEKTELGNNGPDTSQVDNFPVTGCESNGTEAFFAGSSQALGKTSVRLGNLNSTQSGVGPLSGSGGADPALSRHMYGLSQVFQVVPSNTGTLTTGGTPRTGSINGSDVGEYWRVQLHQNGKYRIDVKGSESSQYGGTLTNPRIKLLAGSNQLELLNNGANGVSQTGSETLATGGGIGKNSRLDIKVTGETKYYYLLIHRGAGDNGSFTLTANRLDYPQGRLAPDITVTYELLSTSGIQWLEPAKTHNDISAPINGYHIQRRTLPNGSWGGTTIKTPGILTHSWPGQTPGQSHEIRVRSNHSDKGDNTHRWGYTTIYTDDCATTGTQTDACSILVNTSKKGRINYTTSTDTDAYNIRLTGGRTYVIRVNGKSTGAGSLVDPKLVLRRASDNSNVGNDNNGAGGSTPS